MKLSKEFLHLSGAISAIVYLRGVDALNIGSRSVHNQRIQVATSQKAVALPLDVPVSIADIVDNSGNRPNLASEDLWVQNLDYEAFGKEVSDLGTWLRKETGDADVEHLNKIVAWRNIAAVVGVATIWMNPNPLTIAALSTWTYASWTMIAHHTCHGGYNRVNAGRFNSRGFALGLVNRVVDWLDWMQPEAWNVEHNRLHHYRLNEGSDPDLVQRNLDFLRDAPVPMALKYATVAAFLPVWKWFYYAPNTYKELKINEIVKGGKELPKDLDPQATATVVSLFDPASKALRQVVKPHEFFLHVLGPMFFVRFLAIPLVLLGIPGVGPTIALHAVINLALAELLTNAHAFITIVTNHAGEDLYTFDDAVKPNTGSFYVRQIIGSANYATGSDPVDFSHGFLNYQVRNSEYSQSCLIESQPR